MVSGLPDDSDLEAEAQLPETVEGADTSAGPAEPAGCRQTLVGSAVLSIADSIDQLAALRSGSTAVAVAAQHSTLLVIVVAMVKSLVAAEEALSSALGCEWQRLEVVFAEMIAGSWVGTAEPPDIDCNKAFRAGTHWTAPSLRYCRRSRENHLHSSSIIGLNAVTNSLKTTLL